MTHERRIEGPSNVVALNRYMAGAKHRVMPEAVIEEWYTARLINPHSEDIDNYAADILMRVTKVVNLKNGAIKIYATRVENDAEDVSEEDAVPMSSDGFFSEGGAERGYLLDAFGRRADALGTLTMEAVAA